MSSYANSINDLLTLHNRELTFTTDLIELEVATSVNNDTLQKINLADTIGKVKRTKKYLGDEDVYWLPSKYNQNTDDFRSKVVFPVFVHACRKAGFLVVMKGWEKKQGVIVVGCNRLRFNYDKKQAAHALSSSENDTSAMGDGVRSKKKKKKKAVRNTQRPIKGTGETCKFSFRVYWNAEKNRWYLPKKQRGCLVHVGHPKKTPNQICVRSTVLSKVGDPLHSAFGLESEYHISQMSLTQQEREESMMTNQHQISVDSSDSDDEVDGAHSENAYTGMLSIYKQCADCVETKSQYKKFNEMMHDMHKQLLAMKVASAPKKCSMASLPETDTRSKDSQLRPVGSPAQKRRKKGNRKI